MDKLDQKTRLVLVFVIFFTFMLVYSTFVTPKVSSQQNNISKQTESTKAVSVASKEEAKEDKSYKQQIGKPNTSGATISTVKLKNSILQIDNLGRISQVALTQAQFLDSKQDSLKLLKENMVKPLEIRFSDTKLNEEAFKVSYLADKSVVDATNKANSLTLTQKLKDVTVTKELKFYPDGHYDIKITLSKPFEYFITQGFRPDVKVDKIAVHGLLVKKSDDTIEIIKDGDATGAQSFRDSKIISSFDKYYVTLFYNNSFDVYVNKIDDDNPLAFVKGSSNFKFSGYIGPKYVDVLNSINPELVSAVEYGIFTFIAAPLFKFLSYIHNYVGNWGWAIVILTILVRVILYPLSAKGMVSMHKLKKLSPRIKEIQQKYKKDPQKMQMHMMELYKKHGANPLGGCLPFILQIPIFFAIYRVLANAIELKGATWFYIVDLSTKDPFYAMPIVMGLSMFLQQKITPSNFTDPMQEKLFKFLPLIFTFFFLTFPAGLVLYWIVNNLLSILQQYIINKKLEDKGL